MTVADRPSGPTVAVSGMADVAADPASTPEPKRVLGVAIPAPIAAIGSKLDPAEFETMREHPYRGYQIVKKIPFLSEAAEIVYSHQEKFDGTGYPRGLKGEEIPLGARIFSIADTLDAMTSDRPYRAAMPDSAAREEIERWKGRQFDPEVVKVFLSMPEKISGK